MVEFGCRFVYVPVVALAHAVILLVGVNRIAVNDGCLGPLNVWGRFGSTERRRTEEAGSDGEVIV